MMRVGKYDIDQILFEKGFSKGCGPFACESACCESGVYVDLKEKEPPTKHDGLIVKS
jgi:hypothetical protein